MMRTSLQRKDSSRQINMKAAILASPGARRHAGTSVTCFVRVASAVMAIEALITHAEAEVTLAVA